MKLITPPDTSAASNTSIFLAGSIDMGRAVNWQDQIVNALSDDDVTIFNPRREDWDASWIEDISDENFSIQVNWELNNLKRADLVVFYFDPDGRAPITLLELGLCITTKNCLICCPDGYWKKGNIQVVCDKFSVPLFESFDELVVALKHTIKSESN